MATLQFQFDTGAMPIAEILDAFAAAYGYQATVRNPAFPAIPPAPAVPETIPNPETKAQFARRQVRKYVLDVVRARRHAVAQSTAVAAVSEPTFID